MVEDFSQADYDKLAKKLHALKKRITGKRYATAAEARRHLRTKTRERGTNRKTC